MSLSAIIWDAAQGAQSAGNEIVHMSAASVRAPRNAAMRPKNG
jgi:hypothetical protein